MKKILFLGIFLCIFGMDNWISAKEKIDDGTYEKCEIYTKKEIPSYEDGEVVVACSDGITFSHELYSFQITVPPSYSFLSRVEPPAEDLGNIFSKGFFQKEKSPPIWFFIVLRNEKDKAIPGWDELIKENIQQDFGNAATLIDKPKMIKIKGLEGCQYSHSFLGGIKVTTTIILNKNFIYKISFSAPMKDYQNYESDLEKALSTIETGG